MIAARVVIAFLITPVVCEEVCTGKDCHIDDVTSLLQTHVELAQGNGKPDKLISDGNVVKEKVREKLTEPYGQSKSGAATKGFAEFLGVATFVFIGCGCAMSLPDGSAKYYHSSLVFGFANACISYAISHYSGICQINTAVTFALWLIGNVSLKQALINTLCQLAGAIFGSMLTMGVFPDHADNSKTKANGSGGLAVNAVNPNFTHTQALVAEIIGTFALVFVLMETKVNEVTIANRSYASLAIGIAQYLAQSVLQPIDGCSVNPARSFGPMVVKRIFRHNVDDMQTEEQKELANAYITDHWVFWVGPLIGAAISTSCYHFIFRQHEG